MTVTSEVCKRKKDVEQSAAKMDFEKLRIQTATHELTVKELCDELVTRVSYVFSYEFLPSAHPLTGDAISATFGYTWKCKDLFHEDVTLGTYYRMLVGRLPDGGYKLSRDTIITTDLPTTFTTRMKWRGSYPRDLLSTFCHLHWLPEPEFKTS